MWELIQANRRKSIVLFFMMGIILILIGFVGGIALTGEEEGGFLGILIALLVWFVMTLISYFSGSSILLAVSGAQEVTPEVHKQLFNIVEEMKVSAGLPKIPKIYIINEEAPNAFATGRNPENCAIAVTAGLLARLNRDELQGVVAHETAHIMNRDVLFVTFAGIMLGTIVLLAEVLLRGFLWGGGSRRYKSSSSSGGGQIQLIGMVIAIVLAILAPILARLLYFAISRKREYLADATAARLTRYPEGLASALEKISNNDVPLPVANKVTAPMYIVNPFKKKMNFTGLFSTHPPIDERIKILRSMAGGAGYLNYQKSYSQVTGKQNLIPSSGLNLVENIEMKTPSVSTPTSSVGVSKVQTMIEEKRNLGNMMMTMNGYAIGQCECGLKIKVPPEYKNRKIKCPKCGKINVFNY